MKYIIHTGHLHRNFEIYIKNTFPGFTFIHAKDAQSLDLKSARILLASRVNTIGIDADMLAFLHYAVENRALEGAILSAFVESTSALYTRDTGVHYLYLATKAGASLPGRSLLEATKELENFVPLSKPLGKKPEEIMQTQMLGLYHRLEEGEIPKNDAPKLSVWTIGRPEVSATREVWKQIKPHLDGIHVDFLSFGNENIRDCRGCAYAICKEKGQQTSCIYEDYVVNTMYPSIESSDGILLLTPNYNDMLPANFVSAINRLTALFRKRKFYDKKVFATVVAGHSGAERLSQQIIGALNINKTFYIPNDFSLEIRAHNADSVIQDASIPPRAKVFGEHIKSELKM